MKYQCLKQQERVIGGYRFVPLRMQDMYPIMEWRNAQIAILRQSTPLTPHQQETYFNTVIQPSFSEKHPKQILFTIISEGSCIGYGGMVHIDWQRKEAEVSFLLNPSFEERMQTYASTFKAFLDMVKDVAFNDLGFDSLFTETYDTRPNHIAVLEKGGFALVERRKKQVVIGGIDTDSLIHRCTHGR